MWKGRAKLNMEEHAMRHGLLSSMLLRTAKHEGSTALIVSIFSPKWCQKFYFPPKRMEKEENSTNRKKKKMASSSQNTGGASEGSIPIVFTWPHGGRHVYIAGSFTRWTLVRMIPRQGFPLVYQRVCHLSPGYHQYKFYVDGDYQHDEDQPSSSDGSEIVNTLLLSSSRVTSRETGSTSFIEFVDQPHDASGDAKMSKDVSLGRILEFMSAYTTFNMMPSSGKVVVLDIDLQMKVAFDILYETGTAVAPVWDSSRGMIVRMLGPLDFMLTLLELGNSCSDQIEESHSRTISAWKEQKLQMEVHGHKRVLARGLISAGPDDSLAVVVAKILQNNVATIPVIDSSSKDGPYQDVLCVVSLYEILKCVYLQFKCSPNSLPVFQNPIGMLLLGTWIPEIDGSNGRPLATLKPNSSLRDALSLLIEANVSSAPIVDEDGLLLDIFSRSDITALVRGHAYTTINLDEVNIHQALQLGGRANSTGRRCHTCIRSDPLLKLVEQLSKPGVRRVIIVEAKSNNVEGVISLSDIFRFICRSIQ